MSASDAIKPNHKSIEKYYATLKDFVDQRVEHELAVRSAFQNLLADTAKARGWVFIPELSKASTTAGKGQIRPDGTIRDGNTIVRGYWEAKDSGDSLDTEIAKKKKAGYPLSNIIFEDTQQAVLYQNKVEVLRIKLDDPQKLADLLNEFYRHDEPEAERFEQAVNTFKERVPELARGLLELITTSHTSNKKFEEAFSEFFALCQSSLNPNIGRGTVDEMLVQHLLTERLFRTIFDKPEFTRQNAIAAEVEKVIDALTTKSFNRTQFLRGLDPFYRAIEDTARTMADFSDKQHFLNTVYERFFQGYSVKTADTHGIVYTPQPIVDFMCASVAEALEKEFGLTLGSPGVNILDPCTGTGNFIVNIMRRIPKKDLKRVYKEQLFANEIMLLPYYIAALNIEHAYYELTGEYAPFEGLCFVDTLDMAEHEQGSFSFMTEKNTERVERQKRAAITVIIGNPPYNAGQSSENDNNKNREYEVIDKSIKETYVKDSTASLRTKLYDAYVKFFRWTTNRLGQREGMACLVTNNNFISQSSFDGMRKHLIRDFDTIFHLDLNGNVRENAKLSGTTHNVFGIQVGVGITLAVKIKKRKVKRILYWRASEFWRKEEKFLYLINTKSIAGVQWRKLNHAHSDNTWLPREHEGEFSLFVSIGSKDAKAQKSQSTHTIFGTYSLGISTNRDAIVYDFNDVALKQRVKQVCEAFNCEIDRFKRTKGKIDIDEFVKYDHIKWSETLKHNLAKGKYATYDSQKIRLAFYRPFCKLNLYFDDILIDRQLLIPRFFPKRKDRIEENQVICCTNHTQMNFVAQISNTTPDAAVGSRAGQCFPFYIYNEDGTNRRENITDWALEKFRKQYKNPKITKWDIFYYVYGMLHHPGYREKFADNLKRELPRIPFAKTKDFAAFASAGKKLAALHLDYEKLEPFTLQWMETAGVPLSYRVEKMRLNKEKTAVQVNEYLTLGGIPAEAFEYRLGNRSALEWVIDQYQVSEDKRSGIKSDPNREDDEEYIVRLVGQVVRVSVETVKIVKGLPKEYA